MKFPVELAVAQSTSELPHGRCALHSDRGRLHSRSGADLTHRFREVADAANRLGELVLDGELVAVRGQPPRLDFAAL